jgi:hypothetical protein
MATSRTGRGARTEREDGIGEQPDRAEVAGRVEADDRGRQLDPADRDRVVQPGRGPDDVGARIDGCRW